MESKFRYPIMSPDAYSYVVPSKGACREKDLVMRGIAISREALLVALFGCILLQGQAQSKLRVEKTLPLKAEIEAAQTALAVCAEKHIAAHAFVLDKYGNVKLLFVSDNGRSDTLDGARRKGYTAVTTGQPSINFQKMLAENSKANVPSDPKMLFLGGAVPIISEGEVIGALSVGGGAPEQDAVCAQAGLDKIQGYLQ